MLGIHAYLFVRALRETIATGPAASVSLTVPSGLPHCDRERIERKGGDAGSSQRQLCK